VGREEGEGVVDNEFMGKKSSKCEIRNGYFQVLCLIHFLTLAL